MSEEMYKKLYFRAFNKLVQLTEHTVKMQQELEELYLQLSDEEHQGETK